MLPKDVIHEIFGQIEHFSDCLALALTCKYILNIWRGLNMRPQEISNGDRALKSVIFLSTHPRRFLLRNHDGQIWIKINFEGIKYTYFVSIGIHCNLSAERATVRYQYYCQIYHEKEDLPNLEDMETGLHINCQKCRRIKPEFIQMNIGPFFDGKIYLYKIALNHLFGTKFDITKEVSELEARKNINGI